MATRRSSGTTAGDDRSVPTGGQARLGTLMRIPKMAELVAAHLRRQIVRGDLQEGDALPPETVLMEQFGVSRPTLREAFRVLESEALISVRRGARSKPVNDRSTSVRHDRGSVGVGRTMGRHPTSERPSVPLPRDRGRSFFC